MQRGQLEVPHHPDTTRASLGLPPALRARQGSADLIAFGAAGVRSAAELWRDVARVAAALPQQGIGTEVLLVIRQDRYALAVAVLAAWQRELAVALPPEHDREAITALAGAAASVLHDTPSGIALKLGPLLDPAAASTEGADARDAPAWANGRCVARAYRREPDQRLVPATWGDDWLGQAQAFAACVAAPPGQRWATSVAPTHAHGVIAGVLAPLLSGGAFLREPLAAHALAGSLEGLRVDVLVTVPAQLPDLLEGATNPPGRRLRVISALGPIPGELARRAEAHLGARVEDLASAEGLPILGAGSDSDRAAEEDALQRLVRAQPGVREAAVMALGAPGQPSHSVAVVGEALPELRACLTAHAPGAELLVVREIRRDGIGQFGRAALLRLFRRRPSGEAIGFELRWGEAASRAVEACGSAREQNMEGATEHRVSVHVPADYPYFDGHFPGYPILPGAAQLSELVLPFVRRVRPDLGRLTHMARLKFSGRIQPGETIDVLVEEKPGQTQLDFTLRRAATLCAAGTLGFEAGAAS
jgi:hypothetical protein